MKTQREIDTLNALPIDLYLSGLGIEPLRVNGSQKFYIAPYRSDKDPSLHLDTIRNQWYDHGIGKGGKLIQLVQELNKCSFIDACNLIDKSSGGKYNFSFHYTKPDAQPSECRITIISETDLTSRSLINYILSRKISLNIARKYCKEVHYSINGNKYYAIGFKNNQGGYVLRSPGSAKNKGFKGCTSQYFTFINNNQPVCFVFEGFFNFLSQLTIWELMGKSHSQYANYIILNSVCNALKIQNMLCTYFMIYSYLDNDPAGDKTTDLLRSLCSNIFLDCRIFYADYNDLNDYLKDQNNFITPSIYENR